MGAIHLASPRLHLCNIRQAQADCPGGTRLSRAPIRALYGCRDCSWVYVFFGSESEQAETTFSLHRGLLMRVLSPTNSSRAWLVALRRAKGA